MGPGLCPPQVLIMLWTNLRPRPRMNYKCPIKKDPDMLKTGYVMLVMGLRPVYPDRKDRLAICLNLWKVSAGLPKSPPRVRRKYDSVGFPTRKRAVLILSRSKMCAQRSCHLDVLTSDKWQTTTYDSLFIMPQRFRYSPRISRNTCKS